MMGLWELHKEEVLWRRSAVVPCRGSRRENGGATLYLEFEENVYSCPFYVLVLCLFRLCGPGEGGLVSSPHGEPHRLPAPLGDFAQCHFMLDEWMMSKGRNELIHFIIRSCF